MREFIQNYRAILLILAIFAYTLIFLYRYQRKQGFDRGFAARMESGSFEDVRAYLNGKAGGKIYHAYQLQLKELEAALRFQKREEARLLIEALTSTSMIGKDFLAFQNLALEFAVQEKDAAIAERVCEAFGKYKRYARNAVEARQVTDIYILRRSNHIEELVLTAADAKKPSAKASAYYRIARQYYYLDEQDECRRYLEMAYAAFPNETWQKLIRSVLDGDDSQFD